MKLNNKQKIIVAGITIFLLAGVTSFGYFWWKDSQKRSKESINVSVPDTLPSKTKGANKGEKDTNVVIAPEGQAGFTEKDAKKIVEDFCGYVSIQDYKSAYDCLGKSFTDNMGDKGFAKGYADTESITPNITKVTPDLKSILVEGNTIVKKKDNTGKRWVEVYDNVYRTSLEDGKLKISYIKQTKR